MTAKTTSERQATRRDALNKLAQQLGYKTWGKLETATLKGDVKMTAKLTPYELAENRIDDNPKLEPYRDFILADWAEGDEHWIWIATAPINEIVDWAEVGQR